MWNKRVCCHTDSRQTTQTKQNDPVIQYVSDWEGLVSCHWCTFCPQVVPNSHGSIKSPHWSHLQEKWHLLVVMKTPEEWHLCVFFPPSPGDWGLEVCGHGGGPHVPVDLCDCVCGGHPGLISPARLPESRHSHPAAQLRYASYMTSNIYIQEEFSSHVVIVLNWIT